MWIDRKTYTDIRQELTDARAELRGMQNAQQSLMTTMDWMRVRLTQLEHERAVLIQNFMGVTIAVPTIEQEKPVRVAGTPRSDFDHPLHAMPSFDDVGDDEARRLGITYNPDGTVHYKD